MAVFKIIYPNDLKLKVQENGKFVLDLAQNSDYVKQKIKHRLNFVLGEFFGDVRQGLPYFEKILVSNPDLNLIRGILYLAIIESPGVKEIKSFEMLFDRKNRTLGVNFTATINDGELLSVDSRRDQDFILQIDPTNFVDLRV